MQDLAPAPAESSRQKEEDEFETQQPLATAGAKKAPLQLVTLKGFCIDTDLAPKVQKPKAGDALMNLQFNEGAASNEDQVLAVKLQGGNEVFASRVALKLGIQPKQATAMKQAEKPSVIDESVLMESPDPHKKAWTQDSRA